MTMFLNGVKRHQPFTQMTPIEIFSPDLGEMPKQAKPDELLEQFVNAKEVAMPVSSVAESSFRPLNLADVAPVETLDRDTLAKQLMTQGSLTFKQIFAELNAKGLMKTYNPLYFRNLREELGIVRPGPKPGSVKSKGKAEKKQLAIPGVAEKKQTFNEMLNKRHLNKKLTREETHQKRQEVAVPLFQQGNNLSQVFNQLKALHLMNSYNPAILKRIKAAALGTDKGSDKMSKQNKVKQLEKTVRIKVMARPVNRTDELKQALERRQRQMLEIMQEYGISKIEMTATGESKVTLAEVVSFSV